MAATALAALVLLVLTLGCSSGDTRPAPALSLAKRDHRTLEREVDAARGVVARVDDGDTVTLTDGRRVRYLGIDTPERGEPFSSKAKEENRRLVAGKLITWRQVGPEPADHYGRLLALVEVEVQVEDGNSRRLNVQSALVRAGLASVYLKNAASVPAPDLAPLLEAQGAAINERKGIWGDRLRRAAKLPEPLVATRFRIHTSRCEEVRARGLPAIQSLEAELKLGKSLCRSCKPLAP